MTQKYFVITGGEDGARIEELDSEELLERLAENDGANYYGSKGFITTLDNNSDPNYWDDKILIISGKIVTPKAAEKVTKWEID